MVERRLRSQKGMATVEFSVIASFAMLLVFGLIDFGSLIQAQAVVTNVTREGGNLASRDLKTGDDLMQLLTKSSYPLDFFDNPERYKIYMVKVNAGDTDSWDPTCSDTQEAVDAGIFGESGQLKNPATGAQVVKPTHEPNCGLPQDLYDLLTYDPTISAARVSQFTVVRVYWVHQLMTPLEGIMSAQGQHIVNFDYLDALGNVGVDPLNQLDSILLSSNAIF